jgi:MFS family permease
MLGKFYLNDKEKKTFRLHLIYSILDGVVLGILALNEFVFIKSLRGTDYQLGFLFQFTVLVFIFLIFFNETLKMVRNRKKLLRITALITRIPLFGVAFFPCCSEKMAGDSVYHYIFLAIFLIYYFATPVIFPTINFFLKTNYRHQNFGKLYSWATSVNKIVMIVITFLYGLLMDHNNFAFVYIFPIMALLSIISIFALSNIDYAEEEPSGKKVKLLSSIKTSALSMLSILQKNRGYRHFEIGFMLYGFAFMSSITVITIFFERQLHLNYSSIAFYKNAYYVIAIILLPFFGKLIGRIDPRKFAVITYLAIMLHIFFIMLTEYFPFYTEWFGLKIYYLLLVYIIFHSIFAATMGLLWNIGSAYYCAPEEAGSYQSVHLSLTGVRGIFAPLLGVFFYEMIGYSGTFIISIIALIAAIAVMIWSYNKDKKARRSGIQQETIIT